MTTYINVDRLNPFEQICLKNLINLIKHDWTAEPKRTLRVSDAPCSYFSWLKKLYESAEPVRPIKHFPNKIHAYKGHYDYQKQCYVHSPMVRRWFSGMTTVKDMVSCGFTTRCRVNGRYAYMLTDEGRLAYEALKNHVN